MWYMLLMKINPRRPPTPAAPRQGLGVLLLVMISDGFPMNGCQWVTILGCLGGCIYVLGVPCGVLHLALHEIRLGREANLVSIKSASSRFFWFVALPCRRHISHARTLNNANSVSRLCATKLSSTFVFISFLGNEDKISKSALEDYLFWFRTDCTAGISGAMSPSSLIQIGPFTCPNRKYRP
jgi:hypothetical protein